MASETRTEGLVGRLERVRDDLRAGIVNDDTLTALGQAMKRADALATALEEARRERERLETSEGEAWDWMEMAAEASRRLEAQRDEALRALEGLVQWIDREREAVRWTVLPDWACAECKPDSDMISEGFRCAYHTAAALTTTSTKREL